MCNFIARREYVLAFDSNILFLIERGDDEEEISANFIDFHVKFTPFLNFTECGTCSSVWPADRRKRPGTRDAVRYPKSR